LSEGQRAGPIEVLQINEKADSVKVNNSGTLMVIAFETDNPVRRNLPPPPELAPAHIQSGSRPR